MVLKFFNATNSNFFRVINMFSLFLSGFMEFSLCLFSAVVVFSQCIHSGLCTLKSGLLVCSFIVL